MAYGGYSPGSVIPDALSGFEAALRSLPIDTGIEALDLCETLTRNVIQHPSEEKYRKLRTTNAKLAVLFGQPGASEIMSEMGWVQDGEFVVLAPTIRLDFPKHIVKILDAKSWYGKQREQLKKSNKLGNDGGKADMLKSLEIDRRERAAAAACKTGGALPIAVAPVAVAKAAPAPAPVVPASVPTPARAQPDAQWSCPGCTFANSAALVECEVCATPRAAVTQVASAIPPSGSFAPAAAPAAVAKSAPPPAKSANDFERRENKQERAKQGETSLQDLRALQKAKFKDFESDPNARQGEAYNRPAAVGTSSKKEDGWFDWMWGGGGGSSSGGGGGGQPPPRQGPRVKGIGDLPKPVQRGG